MIELIEHGGGWRCIDDAGRISQVYDEKPRHICETNPPDWLTGLEGVVARLEWERDELRNAAAKEKEHNLRDLVTDFADIAGDCVDIARAELDRGTTCGECAGEGYVIRHDQSNLQRERCPACHGRAVSSQ